MTAQTPGPPPASAAAPGPDMHDLRGLLAITPFRQLWISLSLSSLGDWLGLLATSSLATTLVQGYSEKTYALGAVLFVRLLPALLIGPLAGAMADRLDRRRTMIVTDLIRAGLFVTIPLIGSLGWLFAASFLIEAASLFWIPAKEASVPNLVGPARLESANQLSLLTTYGSAPVASAIFALLSLLNSALSTASGFFKANPVDLALYFDAGTFVFSAVTIWSLRMLAGRPTGRIAPSEASGARAIVKEITEGWRYVGTEPVLRGLVIGMVGAFAAAGTVIALGRVFVGILGGGNAGYGVLFGTLFCGLASGMFLGPRLLGGLSRMRLFGLSIVCAGLALTVTAISPNFVLVVFTSFLLGAFSGVAWVVGFTLVGKRVSNELRGRTFSFLYTLMRVDLLIVLAAAPVLAGLIGGHHWHLFTGSIRLDGVTWVLLIGGLLAIAVGVLSYRQMDDRRGIPLWADLIDAVRGTTRPIPQRGVGLFVAVEGGEGAGKSTQIRILAEALRDRGYPVLVTREPGATPTGRRLRELLLDPATGPLSARAEALLYAADRADHVDAVIRPALERGVVVLTDRYVDSSIAYQGAGRQLSASAVERLSMWATGGLLPDLTVVLDAPPEIGLARAGGNPDRMEREPVEFHERIRLGFRSLAGRAPERYLVLDATADREVVADRMLERVLPMLPPQTPVEPVTQRQPAVVAE